MGWRVDECVVLAENAIDLFLDLYNDYDNAINEVRFDLCENPNFYYVDYRFNGEFTNLLAITEVVVFKYTQEINIRFTTYFDYLEIGEQSVWFECVQDGGEWVVRNIR